MDQQIFATVAPAPVNDKDASLVDLLVMFARNKKLLIGLPLAAALIAAGVSLVLPPVYRADVTILPPQQSQSGASALLSQLGGAAGMMAGAAGIKNPNDMYVGMLKSRSVADALIARLSLLKAYELASQEKSRQRLQDNTAITASKDGLITIVVEDGDQKRVAQIANAYVDELSRLTKVLAVTDAAQRRLFYDRQLKLSKDNLAAAELALKGGLENGGVVSVDSDSRAIVGTIARVRAMISAKEIELDSMKAFVTANNPDYKRVQEELSSLRAELDRLQNGRPGAGGRPVSKDGLENIKVLREVKYHQMLYELLAKQYEMARLDEARDGGLIQVLDPAIEPEKRFKPKRFFMVLSATVSAFFLAILLTFIKEAVARSRQQPGTAEKWAELRSRLFAWK
jgi:tyrosine-protein kinase Etk/Wzc